MAPHPIGRASIRAFRDELLSFADFLGELGDDFYAPMFHGYADSLTTATSMAQVRQIQREVGDKFRYSRSDFYFQPPMNKNSPTYRCAGTLSDVLARHATHRKRLQRYAKRIFWR